MSVHLFSLLRAFLSAHDYYTQIHLLSGERDTYFSAFVFLSLSLSLTLRSVLLLLLSRLHDVICCRITTESAEFLSVLSPHFGSTA